VQSFGRESNKHFIVASTNADLSFKTFKGHEKSLQFSAINYRKVLEAAVTCAVTLWQ